MNVEINNKELSDNAIPSDNNNVSDNRIFDDSKLAKLNGIKTQGLNPYPYKFEKN